MGGIGAIHPFEYPAALDSFGPNQRVAMKGQPPCNGTADVGPEGRPIHPNDCIGKIWQRHASQDGPEERGGRDEAPGEIGNAAGRPEGIPDEHGPALAEATAEEEVQAGAVGSGDARRAVAAAGHVAVLELPIEDDAPMAGRNAGGGQAAGRQVGADERRQPRQAAGQRDEASREQEAASHVGVKSERTVGGSAVGRPARSIETSAVRAVTSFSPDSARVTR